MIAQWENDCLSIKRSMVPIHFWLSLRFVEDLCHENFVMKFVRRFTKSPAHRQCGGQNPPSRRDPSLAVGSILRWRWLDAKENLGDVINVYSSYIHYLKPCVTINCIVLNKSCKVEPSKDNKLEDNGCYNLLFRFFTILWAWCIRSQFYIFPLLDFEPTSNREKITQYNISLVMSYITNLFLSNELQEIKQEPIPSHRAKKQIHCIYSRCLVIVRPVSS